MSNSPETGKKESNKPKRGNGRGSIYQITKPNGRKVWKAAIKDINGKLRTKNFSKMSEADHLVADQRRARDLGENTYATNLKMTVAEFMTGHTQLSTLIGNYVFATSESMSRAIHDLDSLRLQYLPKSNIGI